MIAPVRVIPDGDGELKVYADDAFTTTPVEISIVVEEWEEQGEEWPARVEAYIDARVRTGDSRITGTGLRELANRFESFPAHLRERADLLDQLTAQFEAQKAVTN